MTDGPRGEVTPSAFNQLLDDIRTLHNRKQEDYGRDGDPFANVRSSAEWGIPPWVGAFVRINDKVHRLKRFAARGSLANESAEDSMLDIAVYALIALILYREQSAEAEGPGIGAAGVVEAIAPYVGAEFPRETLNRLVAEKLDPEPRAADYEHSLSWEADHAKWRRRKGN